MPEAPLLREALPALARELEELLLKSERPELVAQVAELRVLSRCGCGDDFCATIYTAQPAPGFTVDLESAEGMLLLSVANGRITTVEILFRDDIRDALQKLYS